MSTMPEPPDFDRLADVCLARVYEVRSKGLIAEHSVVAEQLRQVWNARGAADTTKINAVLADRSIPVLSNTVLDRALRKLDR